MFKTLMRIKSKCSTSYMRTRFRKLTEGSKCLVNELSMEVSMVRPYSELLLAKKFVTWLEGSMMR